MVEERRVKYEGWKKQLIEHIRKLTDILIEIGFYEDEAEEEVELLLSDVKDNLAKIDEEVEWILEEEKEEEATAM